MRLMHLLVATLAMVFLTAPGARAQNGDYRGADAGTLVYSAGSVAIPMNFTFRYRALAPAPGSGRAWNGTIGCGCVGFFGARSDFDYRGHETGKVTARRLPPGDYEIHDFGFGGTMGNGITEFSSGTPFSLRFTIRPGETTYIGNFARAPSLGTSLEPTLGATGYFIVSDQGDRDLAVARRRDPNLSPVTRSVPDVSTLGHPALRSGEI